MTLSLVLLIVAVVLATARVLGAADGRATAAAILFLIAAQLV